MHANAIDNFGWKSFHLLRKKAMEQELSWSGLVVSLSIAFFIVAGAATGLHALHSSLEQRNASPQNDTINTNRAESGALARSFFGINTVRAATPDYRAERLHDTVTISIRPGEVYQHSLTFKNTGAKTWNPQEVTFEAGPLLRTVSVFQSGSWLRFFQPAALPREVKPGESVTISFPLKAPQEAMTVKEVFHLVYNSRTLPGSLTRHTITVTAAPAPALPASPPAKAPAQAGAAAGTVQLCAALTDTTAYENCNTDPSERSVGEGIVSNILLTGEPLIRVGLFSTLSAQRFSVDRYYDIYTGSTILFSGLSPNATANVSFDPIARRYTVSAAGFSKNATAPIRIVPRTNDGVVTIIDYRSGHQSPDNRFRNVIELRYTEPANKVQIINELPLDSYLKGLAETTNASPVEFQKVMATAARTYALYHYLRGVDHKIPNGSTKHAANHFHVDATYDQVYRGYNSELRLTGLTQAVDATRGIAVTYNNKPIVTPYFSNSDGRTRTYQEVWGGTGMPWLKSVSVPQDAGKVLYGHGVGMSARGALLMTVTGTSWKDVLTYFYSSTQLQKIY